MKTLKVLAAALATVALGACTVHEVEAPPLAGPSGAATTISLAASPDSISHDGGSQSRITVSVFGPDGRPLSRPPSLRLDMFVNGVQQDYGTLSARTVVPNSNGDAIVVYTAPPPPPGSVFPTCQGLAGTCIEIVASPIGTAFGTTTPQSVMLRLVPPGVILPPAGTPTAAFAFSPSPVSANSAVIFDGSSSNPGSGATQIVDYSWNFGDGTSGTGKTISHTFGDSGSHNVTLTITNDRGLSSSTTQVVAVAAGALPTAVITVSPSSSPGVNQTVFFNAQSSTPGAGHTITSYRWIFGDGTGASGVSVSHSYSAVGTYVVQLTVTDEADQSKTVETTVSVGNVEGGLFASFTVSPTSPVVIGTPYNFNASSSTGAVVRWDWDFGDGSLSQSRTNPLISYTYLTVGNFVVRLTVFDAAGRSNVVTQTVSVVLPTPPAPPTPPVAAFTFSPPAPSVGLGTNTVTFDAFTSTPQASITNYRWNFGDGVIISGAPGAAAPGGGTFLSPRHLYVAGSYTVSLTVTSPNGTGSTTGTVTVVP